MKLFRSDVIIKPVAKAVGKFYFEIPSTKELYEFGEAEKFIFNSLRKPYHERVLLVKVNTTFQQQVDLAFLSGIIDKLDNWGLMYEEGKKHSSLKREKDAIKLPENIIEVHKDPTKTLEPRDQSLKRKPINHWSFFCPQGFLDLLVRIFGPVRHFLFLVPVIFVVALIAFILNFQIFRQDMILVSSRFSLFKHLIFTIFTINLFSQMARGAVARYYNIETPSFGMMLAFGILPEFNIRIKMNESVGREARIWIFSASLLLRILLFSGGTIFWLITRPMGTSLSIFSAALVHFTMTTFLFVANPFMGADGYKVMSTYLNMPNLNEKATRALKYYFFKPPEVIARYADDGLALRIYGTATFLFFVFLIYFVGSTLGYWLSGYYRGLGIAVFLGIVCFIFLRHRYLFHVKKNLQTGAGQGQQSISLGLNQSESAPKSKVATFMVKIRQFKWRPVLLAIAFIGLLFLPYRYEIGGAVVVTPVLHQEIYAKYMGIVDKVYFNGGERVKKGTVIAEMENYKQRNDIRQTISNIEKKKEEINILLTTPSTEDVALAQEQLNVAKMQSQYSKDNAARYSTLYKNESVSLTTYLSAKEDMDMDLVAVAEKEANLKAIQNQVNIHKLESAKIELSNLKKDLNYFRAELERTKIIMPNDGEIVTMNLKNLEKKYLEVGVKFADIENSNRVQIEISIPEADANQVAIGDVVTFRAQLHPEKNITGHVSFVYPTTEATEFGTILKVVSILANDDYMLKTGMTGYAKIKGDELFVYQAFSRVLRNFVYIEFWSWLP